MLRTIGSVTSLVFLLVACGGGGGGAVGGGTDGGGTGGGGSILAPTDLLFHLGNYQGANAVRVNVGVPYGLGRPAGPGTATRYSVRPALTARVARNPPTR